MSGTGNNNSLDKKGPLEGIVVLDLTRVLAGPFCTMILGDLGAEVIKIEVPVTGDDARQIGPFVNGKSAYFASLNRGKSSIALDIKDSSDQGVFERLLEKSDVLVENFRPGTMEKLGYGWDRLHKEHRSLIYASASGFGHYGPYTAKPAYDLVVQAMGGIMSLTGFPDSDPIRVGTSIGDLAAGLFTTIGITSALVHRQQFGEGMKVDVAMLDCQVALLENAIARYFATGEIPRPMGARHPSIAPFEAYHTLDGHIIVAAGNDVLFGKLVDAIGLSQLVGEQSYLTNELRCQNADALKSEIEKALKLEKTAHWIEILGDAGVPCGPINNVEEVLGDPQIKARNMVVTSKDSDGDTNTMAGNPIKFDKFADPSTRDAAPHLDGDRQAILDFLDNQ